MPKLTTRQKKAFGDVENEEDTLATTLLQLTHLFGPVDKSNYELDPEGQSYQEFMEMKGKAPDEFGAGRINF